MRTVDGATVEKAHLTVAVMSREMGMVTGRLRSMCMSGEAPSRTTPLPSVRPLLALARRNIA